jgi:hypothetical protein
MIRMRLNCESKRSTQKQQKQQSVAVFKYKIKYLLHIN